MQSADLFFLPETATQLATYLREITGDQELFARAITEAESAGAGAYISVGRLFMSAEETELFSLLSPEKVGDDWLLCQIVYYPGTYSDPPSSSLDDVMATRSLAEILRKMAEMIVADRIATAQLCLDDDQARLRNPDLEG